jgi:hypothetical protein
MSKQFPVQRFARGVKVTTQHLNEPLVSIQASAEDAGLEDTVERVARNKVSWVIPYVGPAAAQYDDLGYPLLMWPFVLPPFQQNFERATFADPQYPTTLTEFSLSIDQRAEPFALNGYGTTYPLGVGNLTAADMSRYNMTVRLLERQPSSVTGETTDYEVVGRWQIDGVLAFGAQQNAVTGGQAGNGVARANPIVIADQNIPLRPWNTYQWEISCPGLYQASDPGVKDKWTFALGGAPLLPPPTGDICRLTINGTVYDYTTVAGDTLLTIAAAVAALAAANPLYTVTAVGNSIVAEEITASNNVNVLTCVFISVGVGGTGTVYPTHNQIGQAGVPIEPLELVSFHVCATIESPLTVRDKQGDFGEFPFQPGSKPIQNLPTVHDGQKTGTTIPLTPVVADAIMTGDDAQDAMHGFDRALRERGGSGYGTGYGPLASPLEASAPPPQELLANDAHYSMIMVPMWSGQYRESIRKKDVTSAGLPYVGDLEDTTKTLDVFVLPVPEGFVLHHAFAVWNGYSPPTTVYPDRTQAGTWPVDPDYEQSVGIILNSGWHGDDYKHQQVAYLNWNGAGPFDALSYEHWLLDEYTPLASVPGWRLLQIPLVNNSDPWTSHSWFSSGPPFYMGKANTLTENREVCGELPTAFGGVDWVTPVTKGRENVLEIRWQKNLTNYAAMEDTDTIVGQGGEWVILCGRQVVTI